MPTTLFDRFGNISLRERLPCLSHLLIAVFLCLICVGISPTRAETGSLQLNGESSQFVELRPKRIARDTPFYDRDGISHTLSSYRGKAVLVNFWATWCVPCIAEMPSLDQLAAAHTNTDLSVLTISIDKGGLANVIPFYRRFSLDHLPVLIDPDQETAFADNDNPNDGEFAIYGFPITYAIDRDGHILGYITGRVDWQSQSAKDFINDFLRGTEKGGN